MLQKFKDYFHPNKKDIPNILMVILSSFIYSFGMNTFVKSGNLFPAGFAGLARLLSALCSTYLNYEIPFSYFYFGMNIFVTLFVFNKIGHKFVAFSVLWFSLTSFFTSILALPPVTHEILLITVFGGLINGAAIGLALHADASSGGTDFIAIALSMKLNRPTWNYMMAVNVIILTIAGLLYGWNTALYSIIFQYVSTQTINTIHKRYKFTNLKIVTNKPDEVCQAIFNTCRHGITKLRCQGAFTNEEHWLLLTTVNAYQSRHVIDVVRFTDPKAFIEENSVQRIIGNYYQQSLD